MEWAYCSGVVSLLQWSGPTAVEWAYCSGVVGLLQWSGPTAVEWWAYCSGVGLLQWSAVHFLKIIVSSHWDFSHGKIGFFPWESQLRQSRATQPTVHAGCFSVSKIHRTLDMDYRIFNVRTAVRCDAEYCDAV